MPGRREWTRLGDWHLSERVPLAPAGWALKVGGLVARPAVLSLEERQRLPRTDCRIRHYRVEGWSAVASWHGGRVSELARLVGADARATSPPGTGPVPSTRGRSSPTG